MKIYYKGGWQLELTFVSEERTTCKATKRGEKGVEINQPLPAPLSIKFTKESIRRLERGK